MPDSMGLVGEQDFPKPVREDVDTCAAFSKILTDLFAQYPPQKPGFASWSPEIVRNEALKHLDPRVAGEDDDPLYGEVNPRIAAYYASDTGVPNEKILSAYLLLFT